MTTNISWRNWKNWAWLFGVFTLVEVYDLSRVWLVAFEQNPNIGFFSPEILIREFAETYLIAILVPIFWVIAKQFHYLNMPWWAWLSVHVVSIGSFVVLHSFLFRLWISVALVVQGQADAFSGLFGHWPIVMPLKFTFDFTLILAAFYGIDAYLRWRRRETLALQLNSQLNEARLKTLQMQIQPHFLFNTLQAITALIHKDPSKAEQMLVGLGDLLRIVLDHDDEPMVSLDRELEFLKKYLTIQQVRFGDRLVLNWEVDPASLDIDVPTLIFQPLVENAIEHGVESGKGEVTIGSERDASQLRLWVADHGPGLKDKLKYGTGLSNIQKRLESVYGEAGKVWLDERKEGGLIAQIELPIDPNPQPLVV